LGAVYQRGGYALKLPDVNLKLVAASLVVALALLFGGNALVQMTRVSMPVERALRQMAEVRSYSIESTPYGAVLNVELGNVSDLSETVMEVTTAAAHLAGRNGVWIRIADSRDDTLRDVYHSLHFSLHEAIATGSFEDLERRAEQSAREAGLAGARVVVDSEYVYVSMSHGASQLYEVVPRRSHETGAAASSRSVARSDYGSFGAAGGVRIW